MRGLDFLFFLFLWVLSRWTPYKKLMDVILFSLLLLRSFNIGRMYLPRAVEPYREGMIRPGDIVSTYRLIEPDITTICYRHVIMLLTGHSYFHTGVVVEHENRVYLLHAVPGDMFEQRQGGLYNHFIKTIFTSGNWGLYLEPLDSFIEAERKKCSILGIVSTNKRLTYDEKVAKSIQTTKITHCASYIGKYLEGIGLSRNSSIYHDVVYYAPDYFCHQFGNFREVKA